MDYVIINMREVDLTERAADTLGVRTAVASNGRSGPIYDLDGDAEAEKIRATGLFVERVSDNERDRLIDAGKNWVTT